MSYGFELLQCGYRYKPPTPDVGDGDAEVVAKMRCERCGGPMHYEGYHNADAGSYIALAVCNACGHEEEFYPLDKAGLDSRIDIPRPPRRGERKGDGNESTSQD